MITLLAHMLFASPAVAGNRQSAPHAAAVLSSSAATSLPIDASTQPVGPTIKVPNGTVVAIELVDEVTTAKNKPGDIFRARINEGVWERGRVAIPPGTAVHGLVVESIPSGRLKGQSKLALTMTSIELDGHSYVVRTDTLTYAGDTHTGQHLGSSLGGALQGALYGVLFGGKMGAILGAGAGAAAGTAASVLTGKMDVTFQQGAKLMFETQKSFFVPEPPPSPPTPPQAAPTPPSKSNTDAKPADEKKHSPETRPAS